MSIRLFNDISYFEDLSNKDSSQKFFVPHASGLIASGKYQDAIDQLQSGLLWNAGYTNALVLLAKAFLETGQAPDAISSLEEALQKDIYNAQALVLLGDAYVLLEEFARAEQSYARALAVSPENMELVQTLEELSDYKLAEPDPQEDNPYESIDTSDMEALKDDMLKDFDTLLEESEAPIGEAIPDSQLELDDTTDDISDSTDIIDTNLDTISEDTLNEVLGDLDLSDYSALDSDDEVDGGWSDGETPPESFTELSPEAKKVKKAKKPKKVKKAKKVKKVRKVSAPENIDHGENIASEVDSRSRDRFSPMALVVAAAMLPVTAVAFILSLFKRRAGDEPPFGDHEHTVGSGGTLEGILPDSVYLDPIDSTALQSHEKGFDMGMLPPVDTVTTVPDELLVNDASDILEDLNEPADEPTDESADEPAVEPLSATLEQATESILKDVDAILASSPSLEGVQGTSHGSDQQLDEDIAALEVSQSFEEEEVYVDTTLPLGIVDNSEDWIGSTLGGNVSLGRSGTHELGDVVEDASGEAGSREDNPFGEVSIVSAQEQAIFDEVVKKSVEEQDAAHASMAEAEAGDDVDDGEEEVDETPIPIMTIDNINPHENVRSHRFSDAEAKLLEMLNSDDDDDDDDEIYPMM